MEIMLTANAGVCVSLGGALVLVDALHEKQTRFSSVPGVVQEKVLNGTYGAASAFIVTHTHGDHFSERLAVEYMSRNPECTFVGPVHLNGISQERQCLVHGLIGETEVGPVRIRWAKLTHEGDEYSDVPNYGFRVSCDGESIVVLGDVSVREARHGLNELIGTEGADAAIVNFPLLALQYGRKALSNLPVQHIVGFHIPFSDDDTEGYRKSAERVLPKARDETGVPITLLTEPEQRVKV